MKAVVLLSGGLDSATCAYIARERNCEIYAMTAIYGQRHLKEIESAKKVANHVGAKEHLILDIPLQIWGGSSLTDKTMEISKLGIDSKKKGTIPATYVPARNLVLLSLAGSYAEALDADAIYIGATEVDYSGYPDCREDFLKSFETTLALGSKRGREKRKIRLETPLLHMSKSEIIKTGTRLGADYSLTWSCYEGRERPCGFCDSCVFRSRGFEKANIEDPLGMEK
ncbi:MAG TPA: 7-cyano-7-deazaguanine synthase QueC [Euryarchaeota archaeon]|nr:7-cyano-7-deazaguanine synthase QueC [Euryarchaeota archaeon]